MAGWSGIGPSGIGVIRVGEFARVGQALAGCGEALAGCAGAWVMVVDRGCEPTDAAFWVADASGDADVVYGDEGGDAPFYKPGWSIDLALEQDLVGAVGLFRRTVLERLAGEALGPPHDLVLKALRDGVRVVHRARVLAIRTGTRPAQPDPAVVRATLKLMEGSSVPSLVASVARAGCTRVKWEPAPAKVSVIVPIRDGAGFLERCMAGVLGGTAYPVHEVLIVDNGSVEAATAALLARLAKDARVRVVAMPGSFNFAALNNRATALATGEVLVLLNSDIEVLEPGWLGEMVGHALRPDVGVVGAKLLYPDGRIQHGGIVLGVGRFEGGAGVAGHFGIGEAADATGYMGHLATTRGVSAVTGACLAIRASVWNAAGGMDEGRLAVALNDLDLCLRVGAMTGGAGRLRVVWTPFAVLRHHESATRGPEKAQKAERFHAECRVVRARWGAVLDADPFYNPRFQRFDHSFLLADPVRGVS